MQYFRRLSLRRRVAIERDPNNFIIDSSKRLPAALDLCQYFSTDVLVRYTIYVLRDYLSEDSDGLYNTAKNHVLLSPGNLV